MSRIAIDALERIAKQDKSESGDIAREVLTKIRVNQQRRFKENVGVRCNEPAWPVINSVFALGSHK